MAGLVKQSGLDDDTVASLGKKIAAFEKSLPPKEAAAWNSATKGAVENAGGISLLFGDEARKTELNQYLRDRVGINPSANQPGSITSVIVTVAVHC